MFKYLYLHQWIIGLFIITIGLMGKTAQTEASAVIAVSPQPNDMLAVTLIITQTIAFTNNTPPALTSLPITLQQNQRALYVDQLYQTMFVYENGQVIRTIPVSTGMPTRTTLTKSWLGTVGEDKGKGNVYYGYTVDYKWQLYKDIYGNILIHSVPYTVANGVKYYDQPEALGVRPTSHGCIRVGEADAIWLKSWNPTGAAIYIGPSLPLLADSDVSQVEETIPLNDFANEDSSNSNTLPPSEEANRASGTYTNQAANQPQPTAPQLSLHSTIVLTEHLRYQLAEPPP